jgi:hypothetical protein
MRRHATGRVGTAKKLLLALVPAAWLVALLMSAAGAKEPADSVWIKAVSLAEQNRDLVPGTIESYMQEVDKHGKPKDEDKYRHTWARLSLNAEGEVEYGSIKVIDDGKDITEEEQAKELKRRDEDNEDDSGSFSAKGYSPFRRDAQERMSIERMKETEVVDGRDLVVFKFVEHPEDEDGEEFMGTAWFDPASGVPVRMQYSTDPLPKRVKRMITTMEYGYSEPDSLVVKKMTMDVTGGILFIKKHFHMEMNFSDHWRLPEGYEETHRDD